MNRLAPLGTLLLTGSIACNGPEDVPPPKLTDTGWFDDQTIEEPPPCEEQIVSTAPEEGENDWYWRDRPEVFVQTGEDDLREAFAAWIVDEGTGARIDPELVWNEAGTKFTLEWDDWLVGGATYTLYASDCDSTEAVTFDTDPLGAPLEIDPKELEGRTYLLDLGGARWVEPPVLAGLIQLYFTTPILLGVRYQSGDQIDLVAAPGQVDAFGNVSQDRTAESWNFPIADFSESPFVNAVAPSIALTYDSYGTVVEVPVTDFVLQGTFSPDGSRIGGGVLSGFGDTRNVGSLLGDDSPDAICNLAVGAGVECVDCPDGGPYCLFLRAEALDGEWIPGLTLVER